jgi:hypothetical protein
MKVFLSKNKYNSILKNINEFKDAKGLIFNLYLGFDGFVMY